MASTNTIVVREAHRIVISELPIGLALRKIVHREGDQCKACNGDGIIQAPSKMSLELIKDYQKKVECAKCGLKQESVLETHTVKNKVNNILGFLTLCANHHREIHLTLYHEEYQQLEKKAVDRGLIVPCLSCEGTGKEVSKIILEVMK